MKGAVTKRRICFGKRDLLVEPEYQKLSGLHGRTPHLNIELLKSNELNIHLYK